MHPSKVMTDFIGLYDPWQALANAIVIQAASDYRLDTQKLNRLRKAMKATPSKDREHLKQLDLLIHCCEDRILRNECFFRSDWFTTLSELNGTLMLERLKKEVSNDRKRVSKSHRIVRGPDTDEVA